MKWEVGSSRERKKREKETRVQISFFFSLFLSPPPLFAAEVSAEIQREAEKQPPHLPYRSRRRRGQNPTRIDWICRFCSRPEEEAAAAARRENGEQGRRRRRRGQWNFDNPHGVEEDGAEPEGDCELLGAGDLHGAQGVQHGP